MKQKPANSFAYSPPESLLPECKKCDEKKRQAVVKVPTGRNV